MLVAVVGGGGRGEGGGSTCRSCVCVAAGKSVEACLACVRGKCVWVCGLEGGLPCEAQRLGQKENNQRTQTRACL